MRYARYQPMIRDARARPALWRLGLGLALAFALALGWVGAVFALVASRAGVALGQVRDLLVTAQGAPSATALFLFLYAGLGYGALVAAQILHKRSPRSVIGPAARTLRHFALGAGVTWGVALVLATATFGLDPAPVANLDIGTWLAWLPLGLFVVIAQTGAEEVLFRGYLQSQLAARFRAPAVWLAAPALAFGALHFLPDLPAPAALTYVAAAALFGLIAGDLTARTGSLGAGWGIHFANNSLALLLVATDETLSGLALYRADIDLSQSLAPSPLLLVDLAALIAVWLLVRRLTAR